MDLVGRGVVLKLIARFAATSALTCVACGGQSQEAATTSEPGEASGAGSVSDAYEALCPTNGVENRPKIPAEIGAPLWLKGFDDVFAVSSVSRDSEGNVLLARSGAQTLKLSPNGGVLWSKPFGSLVATDQSGNVYVAGTLDGALELGSDTLRTKGGRDAYVVKLDSGGNVLHGGLLGASHVDDVSSLAIDSNASLVLSGNGLGTVKLDRAGNVIWRKSFFGNVALDSVGNALLTGALVDSVDFGGGALISHGGADVFVAKLTPNGDHVFSERFGDAAYSQEGQAIAVDGSDNVLVGGIFAGVVDFGSGPLSLPPGTCPDEAWCKTAGFVTKLDPQGRPLWSLERGPMRALSGIATDSRDNVVISGALPGGVSPFRVSLLAKLAPDGAEIWRRFEWPETGLGAGHGVAVDSCDNVLWSLSVRPTLGIEEQSYFAKLLP